MFEVDTIQNERLLQAIAEQFKVPFMQIARQAELSEQSGESSYKKISLIASMGLQLVDSYLLGVYMQEQKTLQLEPVTISSVMFDVAHRLHDVAGQYQATLEVNLSGKYQPVMTHRESLEAALTMLGYSFLQSGGIIERNRRVVLGSHKSQQGIVAGLYVEQPTITADMYRRAKALYGTSRQPLPKTSASASAGIFVADNLFASMASHLKVSKHQRMSGLAATFLPSKQLQLV
ncbi:MAG: hypothetical protein NVSMB46_08710 [Candidatus Saccharimonadales bacterium]